MKKKFIIIALCIVAFITLCVIWNKSRTVKLLEDADVNEIEKIVIYYASGDMIITEQEDIKEAVEIYQSMQLKKSRPIEKDGFVFRIEICYQNGNISDGVITSSYITFDDKFYKCARDYCEDFRELYDSLKEKYLD